MNEKSADSHKPFLKALRGETLARPPFWLMRQAGRYLPEYRAVRTKAGSFLDLVYNPGLAAEVTMQPLRRYGMDAAILFSDILVIPQALGVAVQFEAGEGPRLERFGEASPLPVLEQKAFDKISNPICETVATIRARMKDEKFSDTALIGFAGSPWTIGCYMVEGQGSREFIETRRMAAAQPERFAALIDVIADATVLYLRRQIDAGAEAVQLFDSWAGILDDHSFRRWVIAPTKKIAAALKESHPHVPVIGFPKGAGLFLPEYAAETGVTAISIDQGVPASWARDVLQKKLPVQGNLDPVLLLAGGAALDAGIDAVCAALAAGPFVFNLGHGIHKDTPPEHVARLAERVRGWKA